MQILSKQETVQTWYYGRALSPTIINCFQHFVAYERAIYREHPSTRTLGRSVSEDKKNRYDKRFIPRLRTELWILRVVSVINCGLKQSPQPWYRSLFKIYGKDYFCRITQSSLLDVGDLWKVNTWKRQCVQRCTCRDFKRDAGVRVVHIELKLLELRAPSAHQIQE